MAAPSELTVEASGMSLAALQWGRDDAPPVLALHGWLDNAASFIPIAPKLPDLNLIAVDLPGHGLSDHRPASCAYHFVDWVSVVFGIADALHWERFALIGHSMGAGIAALVAGTFPERISGLVMIEGIGPLAYEDRLAPEKLAESITQAARTQRRERVPHESVAALAARVVKAVPNLSVEAAEILVRRGTREVPGGVTWRADSCLRHASPMRFTEAQVRAFLEAIVAPALIIRARGGWPFPPEYGERAALIDGAEVVEVDGGHHVHMDDTDTIAQLIVNHLLPS